MEWKMAILVRQDLKLPKGKLAVQVAHAAVDLSFKAPKQQVMDWLHEGQRKIVLKVADEKMLFRYLEQAQSRGLPTTLIRDAGLTTVPPGTITCGAIGPATEEAINPVIQDLSLL